MWSQVEQEMAGAQTAVGGQRQEQQVLWWSQYDEWCSAGWKGAAWGCSCSFVIGGGAQCRFEFEESLVREEQEECSFGKELLGSSTLWEGRHGGKMHLSNWAQVWGLLRHKEEEVLRWWELDDSDFGNFWKVLFTLWHISGSLVQVGVWEKSVGGGGVQALGECSWSRAIKEFVERLESSSQGGGRH